MYFDTEKMSKRTRQKSHFDEETEMKSHENDSVNECEEMTVFPNSYHFGDDDSISEDEGDELTDNWVQLKLIVYIVKNIV